METPQSWETQEEATAALHEYARQFSEKTKVENDYDRFLDCHSVLEIKQGEYVVALKAGENPFTFA